MTDNHFITVSRAGVLMARRKGHAPVEVARVEDGLTISAPHIGTLVRVRFAGSKTNRQLRVLAVSVDSQEFDIDDFLEHFAVSDEELGAWMRAAVERALDRAQAD